MNSRRYWRKKLRPRKNSVSNISKKSQNGLEIKFGTLLNDLGIKFVPQYIVSSPNGVVRRRYDFYIPSTNTLIEVDGDYYHCNPIKYPTGPKYEIQKRNMANDKFKNKLAARHGYKIIRFWEHDIMNKQSMVCETLKKSKRP